MAPWVSRAFSMRSTAPGDSLPVVVATSGAGSGGDGDAGADTGVGVGVGGGGGGGGGDEDEQVGGGANDRHHEIEQDEEGDEEWDDGPAVEDEAQTFDMLVVGIMRRIGDIAEDGVPAAEGLDPREAALTLVTQNLRRAAGLREEQPWSEAAEVAASSVVAAMSAAANQLIGSVSATKAGALRQARSQFVREAAAKFITRPRAQWYSFTVADGMPGRHIHLETPRMIWKVLVHSSEKVGGTVKRLLQPPAPAVAMTGGEIEAALQLALFPDDEEEEEGTCGDDEDGDPDGVDELELAAETDDAGM
jgi:hypothetical protein